MFISKFTNVYIDIINVQLKVTYKEIQEITIYDTQEKIHYIEHFISIKIFIHNKFCIKLFDLQLKQLIKSQFVLYCNYFNKAYSSLHQY